MGDYPEDLNPFNEATKKKKTGLHFSTSFKGLKKSIRQSFRIKKKNKDNEVEIRHRLDPLDQRHQTSSVQLREPFALPRSRFRERLAKTYSPSLGNEAPNPFEETNNNDEYEHNQRNHRKKKRAPLPPKSSSAQNINEDFDDSRCNSKWSLTSVETNYTYGGGSINEAEHVAFTEELKNLSKHMEDLAKLSDDESARIEKNKDVINKDSSEIQDKKITIPDVVVSCANDDTDSKSSKEIITNGVSDGAKEHNQNQYSSAEDVNDYKENYHLDKNIEEKVVLEEEKHQPENISENNSVEDIRVIDITSNLQNADDHNITITQNNINEAISDQQLNYNERKSIYIAGSQDNLDEKGDNYVEKVSLYIAGSREELDNSNNNNVLNNCTKDVSTEQPENDNYILKTRKFKFDRNELLGRQKTPPNSLVDE